MTTKVLHIDSDIEDSYIFMHVITTFQCCTYEHEWNPLEALDSIEKGMLVPDVVFVDYDLQLITGIEFVERLKTLNLLPSVKIYLMFDERDPEAIVQAKTIGATDCFLKPTNISEWATLIMEAVY